MRFNLSLETYIVIIYAIFLASYHSYNALEVSIFSSSF